MPLLDVAYHNLALSKIFMRNNGRLLKGILGTDFRGGKKKKKFQGGKILFFCPKIPIFSKN